MSVQFRFVPEKAIAATAYLASKKLPELTKGKLCKLLFLADRLHLMQYARPIIGDELYALEHGPIPSNTLNILTGLEKEQKRPHTEQAATYLSLNRRYSNPYFEANCFDADCLSKSDIEALEEIAREHGHKTFAELRALTHEFFAYKNAWNDRQAGSDRAEIPYEELFSESDDSDAVAGAYEEMLENHLIGKALS